jgi:hypothetical protein
MAPRTEDVRLDLSDLDDVVRRGAHLDLTGVALLSNLLLTVERRRVLEVTMPTADPALRQLARGGLWFALAQRSATRTTSAEHEGALFPSVPSIASVDAWRRRWDPSDQGFRSRAWGLVSGQDNPYDLVQAEFVSFVNPHMSVGRERLVQELNENVARGWMDRLRAAPPLAAAASEAVTELLYNLSAHAFAPLPAKAPVRDVPTDRRFALLNLFTTSGGGGDRLHIVVSDTGHGIPATLRPKFARRHRDGLGDDGNLLALMLAGSLPPYGRAEGRGFPRLVEFVRRFGGALHLVTSGRTELGTTLHGQVDSNGEPQVESLPTLDVAGTMVRVSLVLERVDVPPSAPHAKDDALALG